MCVRNKNGEEVQWAGVVVRMWLERRGMCREGDGESWAHQSLQPSLWKMGAVGGFWVEKWWDPDQTGLARAFLAAGVRWDGRGAEMEGSSNQATVATWPRGWGMGELGAYFGGRVAWIADTLRWISWYIACGGCWEEESQGWCQAFWLQELKNEVSTNNTGWAFIKSKFKREQHGLGQF